MDERTVLKRAGIGIAAIMAIAFIVSITDRGDDAGANAAPTWKDDAERSQAEAQWAAANAAAEAARLKGEEAEDRRKGFHCLSSWDGSNRDLVAQVKKDLRDPSSFDHDETTIGPVTDTGNHPLKMRYRAKNGFGGTNVEEVVAAVDPKTCEATIVDSVAAMNRLLGTGYAPKS